MPSIDMEKVIGAGYKNDGIKYGTQTKAIVVLDKKRQAHYRLYGVCKIKKPPNLSIIRGLLFTYSTENIKDLEREELIASKNVNNATELSGLFDALTKPEFISYTKDDQNLFISTLIHYLSIYNNFDSVFYLFDTYFDDEISDHRQFMKVLLECLTRYQTEATASIRGMDLFT